MDKILQHFEYPLRIQTPALMGALMAQAPASAPVDSSPVVSPVTQFLAALGLGALGPTVLNLVGAILILVIGLIVALIVSKVVGSLLKRTDVDNRIAGSVLRQRPGSEPFQIEKLISSIVFWIIAVVAVVAFLDALKLTTVSQPLNNFLIQIFAYLPKLGAAAILVAIAWLLATLAKTVVIRLAEGFGLDERLSQTAPSAELGASAPEAPVVLSETLGTALYWLIFLFFLPLVLGALDLPLQPVQNLLNDILAALPKILKAVLIGAVGWLVARVVRGIVTNLLTAAGADRLGARFGLSRSTTGGQSLSGLVGTIVYVLILIPTATAALDALQIPSISGPATAMLNQILGALPQLFTAVLILVVAYVLGKFVADLVTNILTSIGFNNIFYWLGIQSTPYTPVARATSVPPPAPGQTTLQGSSLTTAPPTRTPSEIVGVVVLVGIVLFAAVAAIDVLNFSGLKAIVVGLISVFGQILAGLVVFAVGLYLANLAYSLISSSNTSQAKILGQTARVAIIALVSAMALQQIGIAPNIVNLAFGLLLGAVAVAIAIAFGLGGRDAAGEQVREWLASFKQNRPY